MKRFPNFLEWRFYENQTVVHLVANFGNDVQVLEYLLGFSPDLTQTDRFGKTAVNSPTTRRCFQATFVAYQQNPWRHPNNVLELPVNQNNHNRNDEADAVVHKPALLSNPFKNIKFVAGLGIVAILLHRYYKNSRKQAVSA